MKNTVAKRYAEALHSIARTNNINQDILQQLEAMAEIWQDNAEFRVLMTSPRVSLDRKREILTGIAGGLQFGEYLTNLYNLVLDKGRISIIPDLAEEYRNLDDQASGRARASCKSAHPLKEEQFQKLRAKLIRISGAKDVIIDLEVDPSLLAGFSVNIDGKIIDGSLKGRLERLGRSLAQK